MKTKALTNADLHRKVAELEAQLASAYHYASADLDKAGDALVASAVVVRLTALGGRELTKPFAIRDGLSKETIYHLRLDIERSYQLAILAKPKGA